MTIITIQIPDKLLTKIEKWQKEKFIVSRTEAIRQVIINGLEVDDILIDRENYRQDRTRFEE